MSYNPMGLGKVRYQEQTTFGTATTSSMTVIECDATIPPVSREMFTREGIVKQGHYVLDPVDGSQSGAGEFSISMPLHGYSSAGHVASPVKTPEAAFLESLLGSLHTATRDSSDSITDTGVSTSTLNVDSAATMTPHFAAGQARACENTSGIINASYVTAVTGTDLTLLHPLESLNTADKPVLSSLNAFLSTTVSPTFFTFEWQGLQANSRLLLEGCIPTSCTISLDAKAQPIASFTFFVNSIAQSTGSTLAESSYTLPLIPPAIGAQGSRMMRGSVEIPVSGLSVEITQELAPALDHNAGQGVGAMVCTGRSVTLSFMELIDSTNAPITATEGHSTSSLMLQIGKTAGKIFCLNMPSPALMDVGELSDSEGLIAQQRTYQPGNYTGDTATGTATSPDPANSDFRISFL